MNIPSIESLLSELDKYKRAYESADAQILSLKEQRNRLTAERDEWRKDCHAYADSLRRREEAILKLRTECDGWKKECDIQRNLRVGVEHGFDCANEELGRYKAYVEQLKEEVQRWKYSAENPNFDGRFDTWQSVAGKYRAEVEELTVERDDLEKECQARSSLLMVLAVIREITGTQKQDGDATIAAVKKLVSEVDYWKTIRTENAEYFAKREAELIKERDAALAENAAYYQLAKKEVWAVAEAALREAKDCLLWYYDMYADSGASKTIATINKILGEE